MRAHRTAWRIAFAISLAASAYFLLTPDPAAPDLEGPAEVVVSVGAHVALFAALGFTLARALDAHPAVAYALVLAWAAATEIVQLAIPGRHGSMPDFALDAFAALAAFIPYKQSTGR